MPGGIVAMALAHSNSDPGDARLHGTDEDAFTVAADAVEKVTEKQPDGRPRSSIARLWILGGEGEEIGWMLPELLGRPDLPVVRKEASSGDFWEAVQSIVGRPSHAGDELVVAIAREDGAEARGETAAALRVGSAGGLQVDSVGRIPTPNQDAVDLAAAVRIELRNVGPVGQDSPPVVMLEETDPHGRAQSALIPALTGVAHWVSSQSVGAQAAVVDDDHHGAAHFARVRLESPLLVLDGWTPPPRPPVRSAPAPAPADSTVLNRVSEGAYIPWPTYREGLASRWRFAAERCGRCGHLSFPVRKRCTNCGSVEALAQEELPRQNLAVAAVTVVHPGAQPTEFDPQAAAGGPYAVVLVDLGPGIRATLQLSGPPGASFSVDERVDTRIRRLYAMEGKWRYGRKAIRRP